MSTRQACATGGQTERDRWFRDQTPPERTQPMKELDEIEARWARVRDHNDAGSPEYTELVDASVLDVPSLVAALRAVLELHVSDGESQGYTPDGYRVIPSACSQCGTPGEYGVPWPCATVRAIESALTPRPQITDEQEIWRAIPEWDGRYKVSNRGRVRSMGFTDVQGKWWPPRIMGQTVDGRGYHYVALSLDGRKKSATVHRLVALAFIPNPEGHSAVLHWDDQKWNNDVSNLRWGTPGQNIEDSLRNGTNVARNRTHCPKGHEYTPENTITISTTGHRRCRECDLASSRRKYQERYAEKVLCTCGKKIAKHSLARHELTRSHARAALEAAAEVGR